MNINSVQFTYFNYTIVVSKLHNNRIVKVCKLYAIDIHCFRTDLVRKNTLSQCDHGTNPWNSDNHTIIVAKS